MKKQKMSTTALTTIFPDNQLQITQREIRQVAKNATTDDLHSTHTKMASMFVLFDNVVREELIKRLGKQKDSTIQTKIGFLKLKERSKYDFDIEGIEKFLSTKKVNTDNLFITDYQVVTKNKKVLQSLLSKGYISESKKVNSEVFATLLSKFKSLAKFVKRDITHYITGL